MRKITTLWLGLLLAVVFASFGCGGNTTTTDLPNIEDIGAVELRFNADGTQPRFSDASNYRVFVFIPGTTTQLISTVFFNRDFGQNVQSILLEGIPAGEVDIVIEALDAGSQVVGQARAANVLVFVDETTLVNSSDLVGFGVSAGIDFTGETPPNEVITVTVGAGETPGNPIYSFDGGNVRDVSVVRVNDPNNAADVTPVWSVTTIDVDNIASPVTQGTVPTGATLAINTEPTLTVGQMYRVSVVRVNGDFGVADFTP